MRGRRPRQSSVRPFLSAAQLLRCTAENWEGRKLRELAKARQESPRVRAWLDRRRLSAFLAKNAPAPGLPPSPLVPQLAPSPPISPNSKLERGCFFSGVALHPGATASLLPWSPPRPREGRHAALWVPVSRGLGSVWGREQYLEIRGEFECGKPATTPS